MTDFDLASSTTISLVAEYAGICKTVSGPLA